MTSLAHLRAWEARRGGSHFLLTLNRSLHFSDRVDVRTELPRPLRLRARKRIAGRITSRDGEAEERVESPELVEPFGGDRTMSVEEASDHLRCGFIEPEFPFAGTCSGGKFAVSRAGKAYNVRARGLDRKFRPDSEPEPLASKTPNWQ